MSFQWKQLVHMKTQNLFEKGNLIHSKYPSISCWCIFRVNTGFDNMYTLNFIKRNEIDTTQF